MAEENTFTNFELVVNLDPPMVRSLNESHYYWTSTLKVNLSNLVDNMLGKKGWYSVDTVGISTYIHFDISFSY